MRVANNEIMRVANNEIDSLRVSEIKQKRISGGVVIEGTCFEDHRVDIHGALHTSFLRLGDVDDVEATLLNLIESNKKLTEKVEKLEQELMELKYHPKSPFIQEIGEEWNSKYFYDCNDCNDGHEDRENEREISEK